MNIFRAQTGPLDDSFGLEIFKTLKYELPFSQFEQNFVYLQCSLELIILILND